MADDEITTDVDSVVEEILDRYERKDANNEDGGVNSVSRLGGKTGPTRVIAEVDSKGVFKNDREMELLTDLINRTNFRSRAERIYFLEWVEWCEDFAVGLKGPLLYLASARSENGESMKDLIAALTRREIRQYSYGKGKMNDNGPQSSQDLQG